MDADTAPPAFEPGRRLSVAAVAIGRNEGVRLERCLTSLAGQASQVVYVDSGSTDQSVEVARAARAEVVELDLAIPFTAARARNAGMARALELSPEVDFIQFLDGDCELDAAWIETALAVLQTDQNLAVVCGRRREKFPEASLWNRMVDAEWDTPTGETNACGGDALMRRTALEDVGGYRETMIAGEEPEMCYRMRQKGWRIRRIDAEMTRHDAAMTRFGQWWKRSSRAGHAYAESAALHGQGPEGFRRRETLRALLWGIALPLFSLIASIVVSPWALLLFLAFPLKTLQMILQGQPSVQAVFLMLGKFPEAQGVLRYVWTRLSGRRRKLIEYK